MAINPANGSGSSSIAQIDVASIVDQLMQAENKPLDQINKKIEKQTTIISDLGIVKSKMSAFADALVAFESANSYNPTKATSNKTETVIASSTNGAKSGNYSFEISNLAKATQYVKDDITSKTATISSVISINVNRETANVEFTDLSPGETIILGGRKFIAGIGGASAETVRVAFLQDSTITSGSVGGGSDGGNFTGAITDWNISDNDVSSTPAPLGPNQLRFFSTKSGNIDNLQNSGTGDVAILTDYSSQKTYSSATSSLSVNNVSELVRWINSLGENISASLIAEDVEESSWNLIIQSAETGKANEFTIGGYTFNDTLKIEAEDAEFSINGISFKRATNSISDAIDGINFELYDTTGEGSPAVIQVRNDATDFSKVVETLVVSYNDLIATHKSMTANSLTTSTPGTFASDPTTLSFINEIKSRFSKGIYYGTDNASQYSLSSLGMSLQLDGSLKFDKATFSTAVNNGLQDILRKGVTVGYQEDSGGISSSLYDYLNNYLKPGGYFRDLLTSQTQTSWSLLNQQENVQSRLDSIRQRYITQYSALNALLYQLSSTSNALGSALDALNNQNNN
jgi:flagellar hook-associated protein 2